MLLIALGRLLVALVASLLFSAAGAQVPDSQCDNTKGWFEYEKAGFRSQGDAYADCIDKRRPLRGAFHESELRRILPRTDNPIVISPEMEGKRLELANLVHGCFSRAYFDLVCLRHESVFRSRIRTLDGCPLPRINEPSSRAQLNLAFQQLGVRWSLCSNYSAKGTSSAIVTKGGRVESLSLAARDAHLATGPVRIEELAARNVELRNVVIHGDLIVTNNRVWGFELTGVVVRGNLVVSANQVASFSARDVRVTGDFIYRGNHNAEAVRLTGVRVGKKMVWQNNVSGERVFMNLDAVDSSDVDGVDGNRYDGSDDTRRTRHDSFLAAVRASSGK